MTAIDVGFEVYSKTRTHLDSVSSPVGGIVVALTSVVDPESDEVEDAFVVRDPWVHYLPREVIVAGDIATATVRLSSERAIVNATCRLARMITDRSRRASYITAFEIIAVRDMKALHDCLIERNGPAHYRLDTLRPAKPAQPRPTAPPNVKAICD